MSTVGIKEGDEFVLDGGATLQVHLTEYQSLTSRCNYWISIQFALLPLFLAVVGIVAEMWKSALNRGLLLWGGMLVIQVITLIWVQLGLEIYNAVLYMECELRPLVGRPSSAAQHLWGYEAFLARQRSRAPRWEEFGMVVGNLIAIALIAAFRLPLSGRDWLGLGVNIVFLVSNVVLSWQLISTRLVFTKCMLNKPLERSNATHREAGGTIRQN